MNKGLLVLGLGLICLPLRAGDNLVANPAFKKRLKEWKVEFPEPNETKYANNHNWIKVVKAPGKAGKKAIEFALSGSVAASEGVKAVTPLLEIEEGANYEFGAELKSMAPACKIFLEGYKKDPEYTENGNDRYAGFVRVYRATIHVKVPRGKWGVASRVLKPPKRYQPTHVLIKLYAYWPAGKVYYTNVFLRKTKKEPKKKYGPIRKSSRK